MPVALLAAFVTLAVTPAAPLESHSTLALQKAQQSLRDGDQGRALASLDSLQFAGGVTVSFESLGDMDGAVKKGFDAWNVALNDTPFRWKPAGTVADVTVRLVKDINQEGSDVQGYVHATREMSWCRTSHSYRLHATILIRDNMESRPIREDEVTNVVAHETGHLLGLDDTPRQGCLMGPLVSGHTISGPTEAEVSAILSYRQQIRDSYPKSVDKG